MNSPITEGITAFTVLVGLLTVVTSLFWMIVGWRAMRAHERIADKLEPR